MKRSHRQWHRRLGGLLLAVLAWLLASTPLARQPPPPSNKLPADVVNAQAGTDKEKA